MKRFFLKKQTLCLLLVFLSSALIRAANLGIDPFAPDEVMTKDGTRYHGLIIKNTAKKIVLEQKDGEHTFLKSDIARIGDVDKNMIAFTGLVPPGQLPPWRMMIQDFRNNDAIHSFYQIPATRISHGYLKNVPYLSYAVNRFAEFDIYGDPENPACISLGAYAPIISKKKFQVIARQFFAGYLGSRADIGTLYSLNLKGDEKRSGNLIFKITPPTAPSAHHAWWLSVYDPLRLEKARVSDDQYKKMTLPYIQVRNVFGALRLDFGNHHSKFLENINFHWVGKMPDLRGFYRTSKNQLRLIFAPHSDKSAQTQ